MRGDMIQVFKIDQHHNDPLSINAILYFKSDSRFPKHDAYIKANPISLLGMK